LASQFCPNGKTEKTGTLKILDWCRDGHCPQPIWKEQAGSLYVTFLPAEDFKKISSSLPESGVESGVESKKLSERILHLLKEKDCSKKEMAISFGRNKTYRHLDETVRKLIEDKMIAYTIPDKPQSRLQKYRLTGKGKLWLQRIAIRENK
jgi:ATP-dependent DNA helicase RecG